MASTADILTATWGALRTVGDHLDRLATMPGAAASTMHQNLRGAVVMLCRATDEAIFFPGDAHMRRIHARAVAQLLDANEEALDFLESETP